MSLLEIKNSLESYINDNITTIAINWHNTKIFTLNGSVLDQSQIDALNTYIVPQLVPISLSRELMSSVNGRKFKAMFQVDIYNRKDRGTGDIYTIADAIDTLLFEKKIDDVTVENADMLAPIESGEWIVSSYRVIATLWG